MKSPAGPPRRAAKKHVRLDLRRAVPPPEPEDEVERRQHGSFWKWFGLVAVFHLILLTVVAIFYRPSSAPPPPPAFIDLLPPGENVKGTPGIQAAPKVGVTTPAPAPVHPHHPAPKLHHTIPPAPQPKPQPVVPPKPEPTPAPVQPKVVIKDENTPSVAVAKPKPKPKPVKKVKVDLHVVELPADADEPTPAPKPHRQTPTLDRDHIADDDALETSGLSKDQIATRLGKKLDAAGVSHADHTGPSGDPAGTTNPFADFYASINQQTMDKWQNPDAADQQAVNPVVEIYVEKDGRVPAARVYLKSGSGNQAIDDSALNAARSLGYTLQPLPDGCPPDISITFQLSH